MLLRPSRSRLFSITLRCFLSPCFIGIFLLCAAPLHAQASPVTLLQQINHIAGTAAPGYSGDGAAAALAAVNLPMDVAFDGGGNLYIADTDNNRVRRVDAVTGIITTVAGDGQQGYAGDGGAAVNAQLSLPAGIAVDATGNIFIADTGNNVVRKVNAQTGIITTVAGNEAAGYQGDNGLATAAELNQPAAMTAETVLHNTRTTLSAWFLAAYLMTLSAYRSVWPMAMFDLPVATPDNKRNYVRFRKALLHDAAVFCLHALYSE